MKSRLHIFVFAGLIALTMAPVHAMENPAATGPKYSLSHIIKSRWGINNDIITFVKQVSDGPHCYLVAFTKDGLGELFDVNDGYKSMRHLNSSVSSSPPAFENIQLLAEKGRLRLVGWEDFDHWIFEKYWAYVFDVTDQCADGASILPTQCYLKQALPKSPDQDQLAACHHIHSLSSKILPDDIFDVESLTNVQKMCICNEFSNKLKSIYSWYKIGNKIICGQFGVVTIWECKDI